MEVQPCQSRNRQSASFGNSAVSETRKLAAILVSDVVGYSRHAGADEDRILARLRTLRSDLIDPTIAVHHGRVVKRTGDGSVVEFRNVIDAVRCAIEVQSGLAERNAGLPPDKRIEFRVGIHLGDVVEESDGDLMGDGVNIAARLEGVAKPGAICLSEQAYWQVKGRLDLKVTDLGATQLRNIAEPIHVYSLEVGQPVLAKPAPSATPVDQPKPVASKLRWASAALVILAVVGVWYFLGSNRLTPVASNAPAAPPRLSIVVLPFANLSGDPAHDPLADALTNELTTSFARSSESFVIAHNTALAYKGKPVDAKTIGKDLGVRYVLEGSVQPSGDRVRVNAQLIDADNGAHVWADQFDAARADRLQMQDEIVSRLTHTVRLQLLDAEAARLKRTPASNPDAEDLALQCQAAVVRAASGRMEEPFPLCEKALALDPNNVRALSYFALKFLRPGEDFERVNELLSKALALDPDNPDAHAVKALALESQFRFDEAIAEDQRIFDKYPGNAFAYQNMGYAYGRLGQFEKNLELVDKAIRLSPRDPLLFDWYVDKASALLALKQYDQAIEWARRAIELRPDNVTPHMFIVMALALTGQESQAREALQRYLAVPGAPTTVGRWKQIRGGYVNEHSDPRFVEYWDRLIEGLREAGLPGGDSPCCAAAPRRAP